MKTSNVIKYRNISICITVILLFSRIYFMPQFNNKVVQQDDITQNLAMTKEIRDYRESTGEIGLWSNAMFGGMPIFQTSFPAYSNILHRNIEPAISFFFKLPAGRFIAMAICFYFMMLIFGVNHWLSLLAALTFSYSANHAILFAAGHNTKLGAITFFAIIMSGLYLLFQQQKYFAGFILVLVGMAFNITANHYQMSYYFAFTILIYIIIRIVDLAQNNGNFVKGLILPGILSIIAVAISIGPSYSSLSTTMEYSKTTMRGEPILEAKNVAAAPGGAVNSSSSVDGLDWEYAMQWSNGYSDILACFVPRFAGGSNGELLDKGNDHYKDLKSIGFPVNRKDRKMQVPSYWGSLPFTAGPTYFGASLLALFILGFFLLKGNVRWWILASVVFTLFLSMGKNFEVLNRLLFDYLPMYNKFRSPNSVTSITGFFFPLMAMLAFNQLIKQDWNKDELLESLKNTAIITGAIFGLIFLSGLVMDFTADGDARYNNPQFTDILVGLRKSFFYKDWFRSIIFAAIPLGLIYLYVTDKLKNKNILIAGVLVVSFIDIIGVSLRYLNHDSFERKKNYEALIQPREVDNQILSIEKERGAYRVLDLQVNTYNSASTSYYHNTIGGYHPAKLQRIQDIIDYYLTNGEINIGVLNMLNTKYVINKEGKLQGNGTALGNAWFIDSVIKVSTPNQEIDALKDLNTAKAAVILDEEFNNYMGAFDPEKNGTIEMTSYSPDKITYESNTNSEQLALFSEAWYGPNLGWKVKIDNKEVDHIRANYILRALRVPAGKHKIEFSFEPESYYAGEKVSYASSWFIIGLIVLYLLFYVIQKARSKNEVVELKDKIDS